MQCNSKQHLPYKSKRREDQQGGSNQKPLNLSHSLSKVPLKEWWYRVQASQVSVYKLYTGQQFTAQATVPVGDHRHGTEELHYTSKLKACELGCVSQELPGSTATSYYTELSTQTPGPCL